MEFSKYQIFLVLLMLISGTLVTISAKLSDQQQGAYRNGIKYNFSHPFFQAACMFLGEALCFVAYEILYLCNKKRRDYTELPGSSNGHEGGINLQSLISGNRNFNPFILLPASLCDMCATSLAYFGLNLTFASSYQMLTGAIMIFTGLLSVAFLGSKLQPHKWAGIFSVLAGLVVIGFCDFIYADKSANSDTNGIIAGDLFILVGLIITSIQMVYEEKFVNKHNIPALKAVGWEGIFGFVVLSLLLIPMYYIKIPELSKDDPDHRLENVPDALHQMKDNPVILVAVIVNLVSIGILNFSGISVTKELSATTRVVLGNLRVVIVWSISLVLKWQKFHALQLLGFAFLLFGTCIYNNILFMPMYEKYKKRKTLHNVSNESDEKVNAINNNDPY